jgi:hypothetical protein
MKWKVGRGPVEFTSTPQGHDMDVGWRYDLERDGEHHALRVIVAGGRMHSPSLPEECKLTIRTKGKSAVADVLDRDRPPDIILVTTAGLREQPPRETPDPPEPGETRVECGRCGRLLPEPSDLRPESRPPCPDCGSTTRTFSIHVVGGISVSGSISEKAVAEPIPVPEPAQRETTDMLEAGFQLRWYCYPDGLYLVQVWNDAGELLDAGGGDDAVEALLEVAERLLPPQPGA